MPNRAAASIISAIRSGPRPFVGGAAAEFELSVAVVCAGRTGAGFHHASNWAAAIEHADLALARRPAYCYAHVLKINAKVRSGRLPPACAALDELVAVKPNVSRAYVESMTALDRPIDDQSTGR